MVFGQFCKGLRIHHPRALRQPCVVKYSETTMHLCYYPWWFQSRYESFCLWDQYLSAGLPQVCICTANVFFVKKMRHRFWWRSPTGVPDENRFGVKKKCVTPLNIDSISAFSPFEHPEQPLRGLYKLGPCKALSTRNEKPIVESNWNGNTAQKGCALRTTTHMYQLLWRSPGFHIGPNSQTKGWEACQWVAILNVF